MVSPGMKTSKERIADEGEEVLEPEHLETATSSLLHQRRKIWVEAEMHEVAVDSEPPTSALPSKNSDVLLPPELFQGIERSLRELSIDYGSYVEDNISAIKNGRYNFILCLFNPSCILIIIQCKVHYNRASKTRHP